MLIDLLQFVWGWAELRSLLIALGQKEFKRSFVPLHDFNWRTIWSFSGGSFQERRKVMAAQVDCALELAQEDSSLIPQESIRHFNDVRPKYSKLNLTGITLSDYRKDLSDTYSRFALIGSEILGRYAWMLREAGPPPRATDAGTSNEPFQDEAREVENLPRWLRLYERFLCLLYISFIRTIIARLRTLALSIVSVFSLIALAVAVYPFQPSQPLFIVGLIVFLVIGAAMFLVFSQMDKDPILARILQSNPDKLEWSFYAKFFDTLALPLLTLLSSLLPGGAGRLIDLVRTAFTHSQ
jgi:hypothetical protein